MCLFEGYPRNLRIVRIFLPSDNCVSVDGISYNSAIAVVVPQTCMCIFLPSRVQQIKYARRFKIEITTISAVYWKMPPAAVTRYVTSRRNDCLLSKQESDTSEKKKRYIIKKEHTEGEKERSPLSRWTARGRWKTFVNSIVVTPSIGMSDHSRLTKPLSPEIGQHFPRRISHAAPSKRGNWGLFRNRTNVKAQYDSAVDELELLLFFQ